MHPIRDYITVEASYPYRLRGADNQQNDTGLLWTPPTVRLNQTGGTPATSTAYSQGLALGYVSLHNRSGSSIVVGIGVRVPNRYWIAGQWDDDGATPFSDDTEDAQDTGATDFALETTTNNDGFVAACRVPFNAISIDCGTASNGGAAVRAVRLSNSAGTGWDSALSNLFIHDGSSGDYSTGEQLIVWDVPTAWGRITGSGLNGVPAGYYAANIRATTAPTGTAGVADSLSLYRLYMLTEALADNTSLVWENSPSEILMEPVGDALVALFSTANSQNRVLVNVRTA